MPRLRRPRTIKSRLLALFTALSKYNKVIADGGTPAFTVAVYNVLTALYPTFRQEAYERNDALYNQVSATRDKMTVLELLKMFISHFLQTFNNSVDRGFFKAEERTLFSIDVNDDTVPYLGSESEVVVWISNVMEGEQKRITKGLTPITQPSIGELGTAYADYQALDLTQSQYKDVYDNEQEDVEDMLVQVDDLIDDIWFEVQATFRKETPSSKRSNCREYGLVYESLPTEEPEEDVLPLGYEEDPNEDDNINFDNL